MKGSEEEEQLDDSSSGSDDSPERPKPTKKCATAPSAKTAYCDAPFRQFFRTRTAAPKTTETGTKAETKPDAATGSEEAPKTAVSLPGSVDVIIHGMTAADLVGIVDGLKCYSSLHSISIWNGIFVWEDKLCPHCTPEIVLEPLHYKGEPGETKDEVVGIRSPTLRDEGVKAERRKAKETRQAEKNKKNVLRPNQPHGPKRKQNQLR